VTGIDPANAQFVGRNGSGEIIVLMPRVSMTREEALVHAAWLVAIAEGEDEFSDYLSAVRGT
jgi:hypothetical protein